MNAAERQQLPTGDGQDVAKYVISLINITPWPKNLDATVLVPDIESRVAMGEKKYGTRLKCFNGRDAALDQYQELLDGINYAGQNMLEHANEPENFEFFADQLIVLAKLAVRLKDFMLRKEVSRVISQQQATQSSNQT